MKRCGSPNLISIARAPGNPCCDDAGRSNPAAGEYPAVRPWCDGWEWRKKTDNKRPTPTERRMNWPRSTNCSMKRRPIAGRHRPFVAPRSIAPGLRSWPGRHHGRTHLARGHPCLSRWGWAPGRQDARVCPSQLAEGPEAEYAARPESRRQMILQAQMRRLVRKSPERKKALGRRAPHHRPMKARPK